jgi:hypothetical protein
MDPKHASMLQKDFVSRNLDEKQECIEQLFDSCRRKLHPLIRMDDVLNSKKSATMQNIVTNMAQHVDAKKTGVWYNVPVALDHNRHLLSKSGWTDLLQRLHATVQQHASMAETSYLWKVDLFPATKEFVVDHVINESAQYRKKHSLQFSTSIGRSRPPLYHDAIYHMYIQCKPASQTEELLEHMDIMYSRWAVQNPLLLRQRILARRGFELILEKKDNLKSEVVFHKDGDMGSHPVNLGPDELNVGEKQ